MSILPLYLMPIMISEQPAFSSFLSCRLHYTEFVTVILMLQT